MTILTREPQHGYSSFVVDGVYIWRLPDGKIEVHLDSLGLKQKNWRQKKAEKKRNCKEAFLALAASLSAAPAEGGGK